MPDSITIANEISLVEGAVHQITASFDPYDALEDIEWNSDNPDVASVYSAGLVTTLKPGTAVITATIKYSNKTGNCTITVTEKPQEPQESPLTLSPTAMAIDEGKTEKITASLSSDIPEQPLFWKSSDENIATVDENGTVTALSEGSCAITATTEDGPYNETYGQLLATFEERGTVKNE